MKNNMRTPEIEIKLNEKTAQFIKACSEGDVAVVTELLRSSVGEKAKTILSSGLITASQHGHLSLVELLIERGADLEAFAPNPDSDTNRTALYFAAGNGHVDIVKLLLEKGAKSGSLHQNNQGASALYLATQNNHIEVVKVLLDHGAETEFLVHERYLPLYIACENGNVDMVRALLEKKANPNASQSGSFPLFMACEHNHETIVELLLQAGANPDALDRLNRVSALYVACQNGSKSIVEMLLKANARTEFSGLQSHFPLHIASKQGHVDIVKLLLEYGANVDFQNIDGSTALHAACHEGHVAVVEVLLENVANINLSNKYGNKPIYDACYKGHVDIVKLLLENHANIKAEDSNGDTPLHAACYEGHVAVIELLLKNGANIQSNNDDGNTPLHNVCYEGHEAAVRFLLENGANIEAGNFDGDTSLHAACHEGHAAVVKILLENGANIESKNFIDDTPLHLACDENHESVISLLLENGANIESKNFYKDTPLHAACDHRCEAAVKVLLENGADLFSLSDAAFDYISQHMDLRMIALEKISQKTYPLDGVEKLDNFYEFLKKNNFDFNTKDKQGNTFLHAACANVNVNIISKLLKNNSVLKTEEDLKAIEDSLEGNKEKTNARQRNAVRSVIFDLRKEQEGTSKPPQRTALVAQSAPSKIETMNENFLRKYFSSLFKLVEVNIQKDDKFFVLSLSKKPSQSDEEFESLQALFKEECARVFNSTAENDAILVSLETKKPQENTSKIPFENFLLLKQRYFPAKVSVDFTGPVPYFVISTDNLKPPYTEQGKVLWIEAVERELSRVACMRVGYKEGKVYKIPVSSLPSSLELPAPFINELLETLLQKYCKPSEIVYLKNTFITFLKEGKYSLESDSKKSSGVKFSSKSSAHFLYFLLKKMFSFNMSVRENKEETKFAVVISEKITAGHFLTMQDSPVTMHDFINDIEKLKSYYSLQDMELVLKEGSLSILLKTQDQAALSYIQRDLQEKSYDSELNEEGLFIRNIPKASDLKGRFAQSTKRFEKEAKDRQDREAREKALEERKNKKPKADSPPKKTIKRPVMKPAPPVKAPQGKSSYSKMRRQIHTGESSQGRRSPSDKLEEMKFLLQEVKDYYDNFKESLENNKASESAKVAIYLVTYVKLIPLLTEWYDYLNAMENNHERQETPFVGKAEDMMTLRLAISYSFAQRTMIPLMTATMKWLDLVSLDSGNIQRFSAQNIFEEPGVEIDGTQDCSSYPDTIVNCLRIIGTCIKESNPTEKDLCDFFDRHPDDFTMVKGLMVGAVQLYRILPNNIQNHSALKPYQSLLTGDLRIVRNVISHNDMDFDVHDIAKIILKIRQANIQRPQQRSPYSQGENRANHFNQRPKSGRHQNVGESSTNPRSRKNM